MGERCQICGKEYEYIYEVSNELWEKITNIKNGSGLRCISCLDIEARKKGIIMRWNGIEINNPQGG